MLTSGGKSLTLFNTFALFSGHYYESTFFFHRPHHIQYNTSTTSYYCTWSRGQKTSIPRKMSFSSPAFFPLVKGRKEIAQWAKVKRRPWKTSLTWPYVTSGDIGRVAEERKKNVPVFPFLPSSLFFKVAIIVFALSTKLSGPLRDVKKQKRRKLSLLVFKSLLFLVRNVKTISKYISSPSIQSN